MLPCSDPSPSLSPSQTEHSLSDIALTLHFLATSMVPRGSLKNTRIKSTVSDTIGSNGGLVAYSDSSPCKPNKMTMAYFPHPECNECVRTSVRSVDIVVNYRLDINS